MKLLKYLKKKFLEFLSRYGIVWGVDIEFHFLRYRKFKFEFKQFKKMMVEKGKERLQSEWVDRYPCLFDNTKTTGFDRHYLYHPAWAARIVAETRPEVHVDISSTLHFSALISAFVPVDFYDFRPAEIELSNFTSKAADVTLLHFPDKSVNSLSCMHVVEHIGLGRYGDPLDPDGDLKAIRELERVLAPNGNLLFVVPVGRTRVMFNAHRVYAYEQIISYFSELKLISFTLIPESQDDGGLKLDATAEDVRSQNYGCGCFFFKRVEK